MPMHSTNPKSPYYCDNPADLVRKTKRPGPRMTIEQRLYRLREVVDGGCWLWKGYCDEKGYGRMQTEDGNRHVHRIAWEVFKGEVERFQHVLHRCDNPTCFNPEHLFLGDDYSNLQDRIGKGRPGRAKLDADKVMEIRRMVNAGVRMKAVAAEFGVHYTTVRDIMNGRYHSRA